jgi:DNA helicase-2/ATP-dependent DNA helicase PcrA
MQQTTFKEVIKRLNPSQLKAVNQIEGPVMVIAGPGTGKTQILAARIANILIQTDVYPENILCLTYTDAGTIAMRKRLNEFIGPTSYRVNIFTFHAFCNCVIQDNLDVFGFRNLDPISDLEKIQYTREIIDSLDKNNPLKRFTGDTYFETYRMLNLYSMLKKEDLDPEFVIEKTKSYIDSLQYKEEYRYKRSGKRKDGSSYQKGNINIEKIAEEKRKMELLVAACNTFEIYQQKLRSNRRYDFDDMLIWVINAFKNNDQLLATYQEQYQYILVDEYQDTSGAQNDILNLLLQFWSDPNVFVVGDDDQSIYRFQGANIKNMQQFKSTYIDNTQKPGLLVNLTENYRSSQRILQTANSIIKNSNPNNRLLPNKQLIASNTTVKNHEFIPTIITCKNTAEEVVYVANQIENLISNGVQPQKIAVLYREHKQADEIIDYLLCKKINVNAKRRKNILVEPTIKKIITILKFIHAELKQSNSGENYLFELLHFPEFGLPAIEIAKLATDISNKNFIERKTSWRQELRLLDKKYKPDLFTNNDFTANFLKVSNTLELLINEASGLTLQQLVYQVLNQCGILANALNNNNSQWNLTLINSFFNFIKSETAKKPSYKLSNLVADIELLNENNLSIPAEQIFANENGVNFLTAHSSKGLEFTYVFIIGCTTRFWDKNKPNRDYKLPDNLLECETNEDDEIRRLFYVAITRAEKFLTFTYANKNNDGKELEPSVFISELQASDTVKTQTANLLPQAIESFFTALYTTSEPTLPKNILHTAYVDELLEKYSLSVTHLNNYLKCPLKFYFTNFIRVPAPKSANMTFGSAVHFAIERLFKRMLEHAEKKFESAEQMLKDFEWFMYRHKDSFTDSEFELKLMYGHKIIPMYYNQYVNSWNKNTSIEKPYRNILMEGVPISGKIDKIEFYGNNVIVVDYKTGQFKNAKDKFKIPNPERVSNAIEEGKQPKFEDEFGGDYWRQAIFYKLLLDYDKTRNWRMQSCEFDFVEPDKDSGSFYKQQVKFTQQEIDIVKQQIKSTYEKIKNKQFDKGCGKDDCEWCNFTKSYYQMPNSDEEDINLPDNTLLDDSFNSEPLNLL